MRMIEQEIIQAIRDKKNFSTPVVQDMHREKEGRRDVLRWSDMDNFVYELWGHTIAKGDSVMKILLVSDCGYPTATTKSRLNAIFAGLDIPVACSVRKKKLVYYLNGIICSGLSSMKLDTGDWTVMIS